MSGIEERIEEIRGLPERSVTQVMELNKLEVLADVFDRISCGGTLPQVCVEKLISYNVVWKWIESSADVRALYDESLRRRDEWLKELVIHEVKTIAAADPRMLFRADGEFLPVHEWPEAIAKAVASVDVAEIWEGRGSERQVVGHVKKVRFYDKNKAIDTLAKTLGLMTEKVEHSGSVNWEDVVSRAVKGDEDVSDE
jgi:hypothetical protein